MFPRAASEPYITAKSRSNQVGEKKKYEKVRKQIKRGKKKKKRKHGAKRLKQNASKIIPSILLAFVNCAQSSTNAVGI